eukprot:6964339-Karenia_brevis.AAC.1
MLQSAVVSAARYGGEHCGFGLWWTALDCLGRPWTAFDCLVPPRTASHLPRNCLGLASNSSWSCLGLALDLF